jgi:hypothetical protein
VGLGVCQLRDRLDDGRGILGRRREHPEGALVALGEDVVVSAAGVDHHLVVALDHRGLSLGVGRAVGAQDELDALIVELVNQLGCGVRLGRVVLVLDVQLEGLVADLDPTLGVDLVLTELVALLGEHAFSGCLARQRRSRLRS